MNTFISEEEHKEHIENIVRALAVLKGEDEFRAFLADICTPQEIRSLSNRIIAAQMLYEAHSYKDIIDRLGLSTATVGRVSRCIKAGAGGYLAAVLRLNGDNPDEYK
ncbi:MAG: hypothetical protein IJU75_04720 [Clostridia bacterium]|nr:hypothetical protein [Clostridia bacterium]MBQ7604237.1 hypothetical protein [Clostridia bacterium]